MLSRCPNCGAGLSLDALVGHDALRQLLAQTLLSGLPFGRQLLRYLGLFRPLKRELRPDRAARLLGEVLADVQRGAVTRRGRDWCAPHALWAAGLDAVLDAAASGSLTLPLTDHAYLYEVLMRMADKQEAAHEAAHEQQRRSPAARTSVQVHGQSLGVLDALGKDPALQKLESDARAAAPMPEAVRQRLGQLKRGAAPRISSSSTPSPTQERKTP